MCCAEIRILCQLCGAEVRTEVKQITCVPHTQRNHRPAWGSAVSTMEQHVVKKYRKSTGNVCDACIDKDIYAANDVWGGEENREILRKLKREDEEKRRREAEAKREESEKAAVPAQTGQPKRDKSADRRLNALPSSLGAVSNAFCLSRTQLLQDRTLQRSSGVVVFVGLPLVVAHVMVIAAGKELAAIVVLAAAGSGQEARSWGQYEILRKLSHGPSRRLTPVIAAVVMAVVTAAVVISLIRAGVIV
ncbi:hypothetical protein B0H63DRAFT_529549 [Podospora didyma]|uniref:Uncharacterized protein n=1 Tax=Podospora didyma TaxID=330526 RepID=A0AAE0N1W9_9PEZI|nr:hypothetical protein B0H63DRAFT_529549 [Podospora didyma]